MPDEDPEAIADPPRKEMEATHNEKIEEDLAELSRRRFLTECYIVSRIQSDQAAAMRNDSLQSLRLMAKVERPGACQADNYELNEILDNLAFLLVKRRGSDRVAVAVTGFMKTKIELVAQVGMNSPPSASPQEGLNLMATANSQQRDMRGNLTSIQEHALKILNGAREYSKLAPGDPAQKVILKDFVKLQLDYSSDKLIDRASQAKRFTDKIKGFELISSPSAPLEVRKTGAKDEFSLPSVLGSKGEDRAKNIYRGLYEEFVSDSGLAQFLPVEEMMVLSRENFDVWTKVFTFLFDKIREEAKGLEKEVSGPGRNKGLEFVVYYLSFMEILVTKSQLFRDWVEVITRAVEGEKQRLAKEKELEEEKVGVMAGLGEPVAVGDPGTGPTSPSATSGEVPGASDPGHPIPKNRDRYQFKKTLKKIVPATIVNWLTSRPGRSKGAATHLDGGFSDPSRPSPGDNEGGHGSLQSIRPQEREGPPNIIERGDISPATRASSRVSTSCVGSFFDDEDENPGREGSEEFEEAATALSLPTDFSILWLIPQHLVAVRRILKSVLPKRLLIEREVQLEVLPCNESEPIMVSCEPLREALSRILRADKDTTKEEKANVLVDYLESRQMDTAAPIVNAPEHAELILSAYLQKRRREGRYFYPYIGISGPPCLICETVLLKEVEDPIYTQVGHGHMHTASIPGGFSLEHKSSAFEAVNNIAKRVCEEAYVQKRSEAQDSHYSIGRFSREGSADASPISLRPVF
ncbi:hypothetical protein TWF481_000644 [Arthrobotrys musiformis]|uniref:Uncharacterized protein n=1 Tax=Arthrobotrys musiformis TaxID=47236 RepID=A0AAV9WQ02_9PEZI